MAVVEKHAVEEGCIDPAASGTSGEFPGSGLININQAVNRYGVRCNAVVREGNAGGVREVGDVEGRVFLAKHHLDWLSCFGADDIQSKDAAAVAEG